MARSDEAPDKPQQEPEGTLADAIAAHLALRKEHGADPNEVERDRQSALAPVRRDLDPSVDLHPDVSHEPTAAGSAVTEPVPIEPEIPTPAVLDPEVPVPAPPAATEPAPTEPAAERAATEPAAIEPAAIEPASEPVETETDAEAEFDDAQPPQQDTGTIEFEWGGEADPPEPEPEPESGAAEPAGPDVLEQTPEFFEETPEYDRLWFEERPPRDFNF